MPKSFIKKGSKIGEYDGKVIGIDEYQQLTDKSYTFEVAKKYMGRYYLFYVDAKHGNILKYVNGAHSEAQKKKKLMLNPISMQKEFF